MNCVHRIVRFVDENGEERVLLDFTRNAKTELLEHLEKVGVHVKAMTFWRNDWRERVPDDDGNFPETETNNLFEGHSKAELDAILEKLDFAYDAGWGTQELFGTIWFDDGTWSERGEYDGSEWWRHISRPEPPKRPTLDSETK